MSEEKDDFMDLLSLGSSEEDSIEEKEGTMVLVEDLTEEDIQKIALTELLKTIGFNNEVIEEVKDMVVMGADAEFADAYSKLSKSNSDAIKLISEFALQKERLRAQKELKKMDIEGKKEVNAHKQTLELEGPKNQTNILVMSREEIFDKLMAGEKEEEPERDITPTETRDGLPTF